MPHIYRHGVDEDEVEDVLRKPGEDRPGREGDKVGKPLMAYRRRRRKKA